MGLSRPMKTAAYMLRLTPEEKEQLERRAAEQHITLALAFREGAKLYLRDLERDDRLDARRRSRVTA